VNPEIKVSQTILSKQFLAALKPQGSKEKPETKSRHPSQNIRFVTESSAAKEK